MSPIHHLSPLPVTLKPSKTCPDGVYATRRSGREVLEEFPHEESQETYPGSAGSTAVMGTALRHIDPLQ